jgi:hypothetical protein
MVMNISGYIKDGVLCGQLKDHQLLKEDYAPLIRLDTDHSAGNTVALASTCVIAMA